MEDWATRIYARMLSEGKTQAEIARACKIKPGSVSGWFGQGKPTKMISGDNLVATAQLLNTTAEYIMTGRGDRSGGPVQSQPAGLDDANMAQGIELLYLMADARPDDRRFQRPTWAMIQIAAKAVKRAEGDPRGAMADILAELSKET